MNANQIPYDQLDWLQIGVYFIALPIVAVTGALLGLLGRTRRGGVHWSTNVGLLGGAVACVIIALGISTLEGESIANYFYFFLEEFRWKMLAATLASTGTCALVAAIAWRFLHPPADKQPFAISMRSLLLVQLFAFISAGSFIGLRLYMIDKSGQVEKMRPENLIPGWVLWRGGEEACVLSEGLSSAEIRKALTPEKLREVAKIPHLYNVRLYLDGNWRIDLAPLARNQPLFHLGAECIDPNPALIEELSQVKTKNLWLSGDFDDADLSPIAGSKVIENLTLSQGRFTRDTIESLSNGSQLQGITIWCSTGKREFPVQQWPKSLRSLTLTFRSDLTNEDLKSLAHHPSLAAFDAWELTIDDKTLIVLQSISTLRKAHLNIGPSSPEGYDALANLKTTEVWLSVKNLTLKEADMEAILKTNGLESLNLTWSLHGDDGIEGIWTKKSLKRVYISSPSVSHEQMLRLAELPNLEQLDVPIHINTIAFNESFEAKRAELGLSKVSIYGNSQPVAIATPLSAASKDSTP